MQKNRLDEYGTEMLDQMISLLDTSCQASLELMQHLEDQEYDAVNLIIEDLYSAVGAIQSAQEPLLPMLEHAHTSEMLENIEDTLDDIESSISSGSNERAAMKMELQLFPFLRLLKEAFYFWGLIYPDKERMDEYYRDEFAENYRNLYVSEGDSYDYKLSIAVTGYNHLDVTKGCIEQLLRVTDFEKLDAELILIDHGSTDGTLEYFESLGIGRVIHFKKNARMNMFAMLAQVCRGEYFAFVSNDILVTKDWAEILLQCLGSDPTIIAAVPTTPNIANLQMREVPTNDPHEFVQWAAGQNGSDPSRWNDRARLMPPLGAYRTEAVSKIGFADPYFYTMEFWDDDFSLRARRAGYRQIVCDDVACHHFGSVTGKEFQIKESTLAYGRALFIRKHGVDAWGSGFCYKSPEVCAMADRLKERTEASVLCIDCGFGDSALQIRNELRHSHKTCSLYNITAQREYISDLKSLGDGFSFEPDIVEGVKNAFEGVTFDGVYIERDIARYEHPELLLKAAYERIEKGGTVVFSCSNPYWVFTLNSLMSMAPLGNPVVLADPNDMLVIAESIFSQVDAGVVERFVEGVREFAQKHFGERQDTNEVIARLCRERYYFVAEK